MFNKAMIDKMLQLPDDRLLAMLRLILSSTGVQLGEHAPDEMTVRKIRALLREITDSDIERLTFLMQCYKNGG